MKKSIHMTRVAVMVLASFAFFVLVASASLARAQEAGGAPNHPASKSKAEKSGEAGSDLAAKLAEASQTNPVETTEIGIPSDSSKPLSRSGSAGTSGPVPILNRQSPSEGWQIHFSPYLFLAGIKGTVGIGRLTGEVNASFRDLIENANFGFMGRLEARKNRFLVLTDVMYLHLSDSRGTPGPLFSSLHADLKAFILNPEVGYRLAETKGKGASLDVTAGIRFWHLNSDLDFTPGFLSGIELTGSRDWVDGVGGLQGRVRLSPRLFLFGLGDGGAGGSNFTYQLFGGGGIQISQRVALVIGYRYLKTDYDRDNFLFDVALKGALVGVTFRF